jgi:hypothetical protein
LKQVESACVAPLLGLTELPTPRERLRKPPTFRATLLDAREDCREMKLKKIFEKACGNRLAEILLRMSAPLAANSHNGSGSVSTQAAIRMIACQRGSSFPVGAGTPGNRDSARLILRRASVIAA